jgi:hypothetical protein
MRNGSTRRSRGGLSLVALFKWDDLVFTHVSARVPGADNQFLINPYGFMFEEITASSLVKIDTGREQVRRHAVRRATPAGFTIPQRGSRRRATTRTACCTPTR